MLIYGFNISFVLLLLYCTCPLLRLLFLLHPLLLFLFLLLLYCLFFLLYSLFLLLYLLLLFLLLLFFFLFSFFFFCSSSYLLAIKSTELVFTFIIVIQNNLLQLWIFVHIVKFCRMYFLLISFIIISVNR